MSVPARHPRRLVLAVALAAVAITVGCDRTPTEPRARLSKTDTRHANECRSGWVIIAGTPVCADSL